MNNLTPTQLDQYEKDLTAQKAALEKLKASIEASNNMLNKSGIVALFLYCRREIDQWNYNRHKRNFEQKWSSS